MDEKSIRAMVLALLPAVPPGHIQVSHHSEHRGTALNHHTVKVTVTEPEQLSETCGGYTVPMAVSRAVDQLRPRVARMLERAKAEGNAED